MQVVMEPAAASYSTMALYRRRRKKFRKNPRVLEVYLKT